MHPNKQRQRKNKNQPPPLRIMEKLKKREQNSSAQDKSSSSSSRSSPYTKLSFIFHLLLFLSSVCVGFLGFSFVLNTFNGGGGGKHLMDIYKPFGDREQFPMYDIFNDSRRTWSTLIPGHYFGLQAARPNFSLVSMMWFRQQPPLAIRHLCRHEDGFRTYHWNHNDLHGFGHQTLIDANLNVSTGFIKINPEITVSRVRIEDVQQTQTLHSLILYTVVQNEEDNITLFRAEKGFVSLETETQATGNYLLNFNVRHRDAIMMENFLTTNSSMARLEQTIREHFYPINHNGYRMAGISNRPEDDQILQKKNFIAYQIIFNNSIEVDIELIFNEHQETADINDQYESILVAKQKVFETNFVEKFKFRNYSDEMIRFARTILSSTIGSIGYYHGYAFVDSDQSPQPRPYGPLQLLTVVPSRPFFPRGFLWDEGFHQLLIGRWDPKLSMDIIKSWLSLMNKHGWIPREVILGSEAMSRVPKEYIVQHASNGNPPSLLLAIESLVDGENLDQQWLRDIYPRLNQWFQWFNHSQIGTKFPYTFRWRGRNSTTNLELNPKTLASGFDDYPRATHPTDDEIHLDLRCWMAMASRLMVKITKVLGMDQERQRFESYNEILSDEHLLEQLHWSDRYQMFCDRGLHSTNVVLEKFLDPSTEKITMEREVLSPPRYDHVPEFGYVSLFPFIMTLLKADNPKLSIMLNHIQDPQLLWTPYGLRSLAKTSSYYQKYNTEHDGPYWRGAIWINMNYLVLKALNHYARTPGPYSGLAQQIHSQLKTNLVKNVHQEFVRSGYVWEQYDDRDGHGKGTHPFTGWTSLIVQIMSDE